MNELFISRQNDAADLSDDFIQALVYAGAVESRALELCDGDFPHAWSAL